MSDLDAILIELVYLKREITYWFLWAYDKIPLLQEWTISLIFAVVLGVIGLRYARQNSRATALLEKRPHKDPSTP